MWRNILIAIVVVMVSVGSVGKGQIVVHEPCFVVEKIMDRLDGVSKRLEAVRNPAYGTGVVAAGVDNGILKVYRISNGNIETIATKSGYPSTCWVESMRIDWAGCGGIIIIAMMRML